MSLYPYFGCNECTAVTHIVGNVEDIKALIKDHVQWKNGYPCVISGCLGKMLEITDRGTLTEMHKAAKQGLLRFYTLSPAEFFRALCGFGLPDELGCSPEVVTAMFSSALVTSVGVRGTPSGRTILDQIFLDNGVCLHLAASPQGSSVYKITRTKDEKLENSRVDLLPVAEERDLLGKDEGV